MSDVVALYKILDIGESDYLSQEKKNLVGCIVEHTDWSWNSLLPGDAPGYYCVSLKVRAPVNRRSRFRAGRRLGFTDVKLEKLA